MDYEMESDTEKEAIRKGMAELKMIYIESGLETADKMLKEIFDRNGNNDFLFRDYASACNCFHGGMNEIMCDDFSGTWDFYEYCKFSHNPLWSTPSEWFESMKGEAEYIGEFIKDAEAILAEHNR